MSVFIAELSPVYCCLVKFKLHNLCPNIATLFWPEEDEGKGEAVLGDGDADETQAGQ